MMIMLPLLLVLVLHLPRHIGMISFRQSELVQGLRRGMRVEQVMLLVQVFGVVVEGEGAGQGEISPLEETAIGEHHLHNNQPHYRENLHHLYLESHYHLQ